MIPTLLNRNAVNARQWSLARWANGGFCFRRTDRFRSIWAAGTTWRPPLTTHCESPTAKRTTHKGLYWTICSCSGEIGVVIFCWFSVFFSDVVFVFCVAIVDPLPFVSIQKHLLAAYNNCAKHAERVHSSVHSASSVCCICVYARTIRKQYRLHVHFISIVDTQGVIYDTLTGQEDSRLIFQKVTKPVN